jgi:hypothetical protein
MWSKNHTHTMVCILRIIVDGESDIFYCLYLEKNCGKSAVLQMGYIVNINVKGYIVLSLFL